MSLLRKFADLFRDTSPKVPTKAPQGFHQTMPLEPILTPSSIVPVDELDLSYPGSDVGEEIPVAAEDVSDSQDEPTDVTEEDGETENPGASSEDEELGEPLGFVEELDDADDDEPDETSKSTPQKSLF